MDRDSRRLSHSKGNKIVTQPTIPLSSDGDDGDQRVVDTKLYTKSDGKWFSIDSEQKSDGWHGSTKVIKVTGIDFVCGTEDYYAYYSQGKAAHSGSISDEAWMFAPAIIPFGFKAYKYIVYGEIGILAAGLNGKSTIWEVTIDTAGFVSIPTTPPYPSFGTEAVFNTALIGNDRNYILIACQEFRGSGMEKAWGAYVYIEPNIPE